MIRKLKILTFFVIYLFSISVFAQNSRGYVPNSEIIFPKKHSLEEYLVIASSNNQELRGAFDQWKAALEVALEVNVLPDPRFSFQYFIEPVETRTGPQRASFSLSQTFPWMGKLSLKGKKAEENANAFKAQFDQLFLEIYLDVKRGYYEYAYLFQAIKITKDILDILLYVDNVARSGYLSGNVAHSEVIRTQVELGKVEDQLRSLEDMIKPIMAKLNALMNLPMNHPLKIPDSIPQVYLSATDELLQLSLKVNNPNLLTYYYLAKSEEYAIKLAKKEYYPDLTFGIETIDTGSSRTNGVRDSGKNPFIATVSMNIPLWQQNRRAAVRKSQKSKRAALEQKKGLEENLLADLELALYKYRDSLRKINLYGKNLVPKAKEALIVTLDAFETNRKNFIDLLDTERTLLELELAYKRSLADQAIYLAEIEALTAIDLKTLER